MEHVSYVKLDIAHDDQVVPRQVNQPSDSDAESPLIE